MRASLELAGRKCSNCGEELRLVQVQGLWYIHCPGSGLKVTAGSSYKTKRKALLSLEKENPVMKIILGEDTFEEATSPSPWEVISEGNVSLSPAQLTDPENILIRTPGAPRLEELGPVLWNKNPGDFSASKNPWKATKSGVAELETSLRNIETGDKWKILLRGQARRYIVVQVHPIPHLP